VSYVLFSDFYHASMPLSYNQPRFTVAVLTLLRSSLKHKTFKNSLTGTLSDFILRKMRLRFALRAERNRASQT
jgi:hypothetical protein